MWIVLLLTKARKTHAVIKHRATVAYLEAQNKLDAPLRRIYAGIGFTIGIVFGIFIGLTLGQ
jgi:hypothetical protein